MTENAVLLALRGALGMVFLAFVLAVAAVAVASLGAGEWSLDHRLGWSASLSGATAVAIAAGGLAAAFVQLALFFRRPR